MRNTMARLALAASVLAALLVLPATTTAAGAGTTSSPSYYVSIGDSYAIGDQPDPGEFRVRRGDHHLTAHDRRLSGSRTTRAERRSLPHRPAGDGRHRLHRRAPWSRRVDHHLHRWQ